MTTSDTRGVPPMTTQADPLREALNKRLDEFYRLAQDSAVDVNGAPRDRSRWTFKAWRCEDVDAIIEIASTAITALAQSPAPQGEGMRETLERAAKALYEFDFGQESTNIEFPPWEEQTTGNLQKRYRRRAAVVLAALATPIPSDRAGREEETARECFERIYRKHIHYDARGLTIDFPEAEALIAAALRQSASAGVERAAEWHEEIEAIRQLIWLDNEPDLDPEYIVEAHERLGNLSKAFHSLSTSASRE